MRKQGADRVARRSAVIELVEVRSLISLEKSPIVESIATNRPGSSDQAWEGVDEGSPLAPVTTSDPLLTVTKPHGYAAPQVIDCSVVAP